MSLFCVAAVYLFEPIIFLLLCSMQADLEESKTQENEKLQSALQEMQNQFKETKALLEEERKAARKAAEMAPVIQEVPVVDNAMLEKLNSENEKLKVNSQFCENESKLVNV